MRSIKFRGKRIDNNDWVYGYYAKELDGSSRILLDAGFKWDCQPMLSYFEVIENTVGQFTGLTDCNGVEIFEGDKLKFGLFEYIVIFEDAKFLVIESNVKSLHPCKSSLGNMQYDRMKVIGNIHEESQ